jgi:hypothetical protein
MKLPRRSHHITTHASKATRERLCRSFVKAKERLLKRWTEFEIDAIEQEFQELKLAYQNEGPLQDALDNGEYITSLQTGWNYVQN